jgi:hypothetical protein
MVAFPKGKHLEGHYALLKGGWEALFISKIQKVQAFP